MSAGAQNGWVRAGCGNALPQYLPNPMGILYHNIYRIQKNKFPLKFIFTKSIFFLLSTD